MSENPYAAPGADLGGESGSPGAPGTGDIDLGRCLSDAWANCWSNFPLWLGVVVVYLLLAFLGVVTVVGIFLLVPVLVWGMIVFALKMHDGGADFSDLWVGFQNYGQTLVAMLVLIAVITFLSILAGLPQDIGQMADIGLLTGLGALINLGFTFLVNPRLSLAYFYAVDRELPPMEALRQAWEDTQPVMLKLALLMLASVAVILAGILALGVGVIPATVISGLMWVSAYRQLAGGGAAA